MRGQLETTPMTTATAGKLPVTVVIFTLNEEKNLPDALASVRWAEAVVVVDSHSPDRTAEIAVAAGAKVVQFDYSGHGPKKMEWSLRNLQFDHEWVFLLDADERVTPQLRAEIAEAVERGDADGYCVDREFHFMGREVRCFAVGSSVGCPSPGVSVPASGAASSTTSPPRSMCSPSMCLDS
jgi:Glycosyl transferase family 2